MCLLRGTDWNIKTIQLVPLLWQLLGDLSTRKASAAADRSVWDLWWTKWNWDRFFSSTSLSPCQYHSQQRCTLIFTCMLLSPEEQTGETWEPSTMPHVTSSSSHRNNSRVTPCSGPTDSRIQHNVTLAQGCRLGS